MRFRIVSLHQHERFVRYLEVDPKGFWTYDSNEDSATIFLSWFAAEQQLAKAKDKIDGLNAHIEEFAFESGELGYWVRSIRVPFNKILEELCEV